MGVSLVVGSLIKMWKQKQDNEAAKHRQMMEAFGVAKEERSEIREAEEGGYTWTRRTIALSAVFSIVVLPKLAAVMFPDMHVTLGWTEYSGGFWPFTEGKDMLTWHVAKGLVITPLDTHMVASIVGLYFGGSLAGHRG